METESVYELITLLCHSLCKDNKIRREIDIQKYRSTAWEILLKKSVDPYSVNQESLDELSYIQFEMKMCASNGCQRKKCDEFDKLLEDITSSSYFKDDPGKSILSLLITLRNTQSHQQFVEIEETTLPSDSLFQMSQFDCFTQFSSTTDAQSESRLLPDISSHNKLKNNPYVPLLNRTSMFKLSEEPMNPATITQTQSFFTLQPESVPRTPHIFLPRLIDDRENKNLNDYKTDLNKSVLGHNWENLGKHEIPHNTKFITETESVLHLKALESNTRRKPAFTPKIMSLEHFLRDLKSLVVGIRSETFTFDDAFVFTLTKDLTIPNSTPKSLHRLIKNHLLCGTCYKRLQVMTEKNYYDFKHIFDGFVFKVSHLMSLLVVFMKINVKFSFIFRPFVPVSINSKHYSINL